METKLRTISLIGLLSSARQGGRYKIMSRAWLKSNRPTYETIIAHISKLFKFEKF